MMWPTALPPDHGWKEGGGLQTDRSPRAGSTRKHKRNQIYQTRPGAAMQPRERGNPNRGSVAVKGPVVRHGARPAAAGVGVDPDLSGAGVDHLEVVLDAGGAAGEHPEVAVDGAGVDHLGEHLPVLRGEEPEVAGRVRGIG